MTPPVTRSGHLVLLPRQQRGARRSARRASATTRRPRARSRRARPPSARGCSRSSTPGGVGPHGVAKYHYDPANPTTNEVPAVLRQLGVPRRVHAGHAARGQARLAEPRVQDQQLPGLRRRRTSPNPTFDVRVRQPDGHAVRARTASFYLLTYGDGFFAINPDAGMYRWDYVKGQRAPKAVLTTDKTDGAAPLTVNFSSVGSSDAGPGRLDPLRVGLRRRLADLDRGQPDAHLHQGAAASPPS